MYSWLEWTDSIEIVLEEGTSYIFRVIDFQTEFVLLREKGEGDDK